MFEQVKASLLGFGNFSEQELAEITARLKRVMICKGGMLINEGDICQQFYYVSSGSFRQYYMLEHAEETTLNLHITGDWIVEHQSFMSQSPSCTIIQAVQDSEVFELSIYYFHELIRISPSYFRLGHILEQSTQVQAYRQNRLSPEEKYTLLLNNKPQIIQQFPLKHIASFLGITPETLSRVRRKVIS
ncbi:Crp/Fnr family transcriptional regulator [Mucilaginibacter sp. KACC 22063]|uniref:Crp/Fnr family transcriptional regulator n=1 Tax=Mucilaginibacter sp. KACC 22063 TaxID=3025666 RepID=UPI0023660798|nr:Crp/Fnr family transcriptional regulator [Mucilaginibacter sp. KACC 22063]WDF54377.1 Crp/Fnr family transcriptional regulator [Mucilaginibacter sp. KACC 22063]